MTPIFRILVSDLSFEIVSSGTYKNFHSFTATVRLGAKVPNHLATCNTVESESNTVR